MLSDLARGERSQPGQASAARGAMLPSRGEAAELQRERTGRDYVQEWFYPTVVMLLKIFNFTLH